jgi:hypothetical protein
MEKYYRERFEAQRRLARKVAPFMEADQILAIMRAEVRQFIPWPWRRASCCSTPRRANTPGPCSAPSTTGRSTACSASATARRCRRPSPGARRWWRPAPSRSSGTTARASGSAWRRPSRCTSNGDLLSVVNVVVRPGARFSRKEFFLLRDFTESVGNLLTGARKHWAITQEKIRINRMLSQLSPFVPQSVRRMVEDDPELINREKEKKDVSVLFLDLEGYTRLSIDRSADEVNTLVETIFSSFVDPIHRSHGDINETPATA